VPRISWWLLGRVAPPAGGSVKADWTGLGVGVAVRDGAGVGVGVAVVVGRVPAPADGFSPVPQAYEITRMTMAKPSSTTARRRQ
jgi:hypothetical protein